MSGIINTVGSKSRVIGGEVNKVIAWANMSADSTANDSFNISSTSQGSAGRYVLNFAQKPATANYSMVAGGSDIYWGTVVATNYPSAPTTSTFKFSCNSNKGNSGANYESSPSVVTCMAIGN